MLGSFWVGFGEERACSFVVACSGRCIWLVRSPEVGWAVVAVGAAVAVWPGVEPRSCMLVVTIEGDGRSMTSFRMCPVVGVAAPVLLSLEPIG